MENFHLYIKPLEPTNYICQKYCRRLLQTVSTFFFWSGRQHEYGNFMEILSQQGILSYAYFRENVK